MQNGLRDHTGSAYGAGHGRSNQHEEASNAGLAQKAAEGLQKASEAASTTVAQSADMIAGGAHALSQKVSEAGQQVSDSGDMLMKAFVEQVRAKPILALGAAVAAGFVLSNLLKN